MCARAHEILLRIVINVSRSCCGGCGSSVYGALCVEYAYRASSLSIYYRMDVRTEQSLTRLDG